MKTGREIIEAALQKAALGDPDNSPFGMDNPQSCAYQQGMASAYQHALEMIPAAKKEPVAVRYDFDGYGYKYIDNGSGSDWQTRHPEGELLYAEGNAE